MITAILAIVLGATDYNADPTTLAAQLQKLQPGDTLHLAAGTYDHFTIASLNGSEGAWFTITGPETGAPANVVANACCNTVEIDHSSYVAIRNLTIDGQDNGGSFGVSAKGALGNLVHHVRVERCTFVHHAGDQQQVAISTKTPTWGWEIRENRITNAGTGLYLGNSDGTCPFIRGLIERNLVQDPIGYCMEIKYQLPWPLVAGIPAGDGSTIIRRNVFIKGDNACDPSLCRPNLLVGGFPDTGTGANDRYEIYGNLFFHNPHESLFQASGRVTIHDNIFVDANTNAVLLQNHDLPLKQAFVYNNTVYTNSNGINFSSAASQGSASVGNLVFATTPLAGAPADQRDNITGAVAEAATYVNSPSMTLGSMDFFPKAGKCTGTAVDLTSSKTDRDYDRDFNGTSKGGFTYRGAYAGEGTNPGWTLAADVPPELGVNPGVDAGAQPGLDAAQAAQDAALVADARPTFPDGSTSDAADAAQTSGDSGLATAASGCGCGSTGAIGWSAPLLLALGWLRRRFRKGEEGQSARVNLQVCLTSPRGPAPAGPRRARPASAAAWR